MGDAGQEQEPGLQAGRVSGFLVAAIWAARETVPFPEIRGPGSHGRRPIHDEDAAVLQFCFHWYSRNQKFECSRSHIFPEFGEIY